MTMTPPVHVEDADIIDANLNVQRTTIDDGGDGGNACGCGGAEQGKDQNGGGGEGGCHCEATLLTDKPSATDFTTHFVIHRQSQSQTQLNDKEDVDASTPNTSSSVKVSNKDDINDNATIPVNSTGALCTPTATMVPVTATPVDPGLCASLRAEVRNCMQSLLLTAMPRPQQQPPAPSPRRTSARFQHPFMKSQNSPVITKSGQNNAASLSPVKFPQSPMDCWYEPISAFCIQEVELKLKDSDQRHNEMLDNCGDKPSAASSGRLSLCKIFETCRQRGPIPIASIFNELRHLKKIGEGVYGEVYSGSFCRLSEYTWVYKIVAIEGEAQVNGERQRKFEEVMPEIIVSQNLNLLRNGHKDCKTDGYVHMRNARIATGKYPARLVKCWESFDKEYESDNDKPEFPEEQLYMVLEFEFAGQDIESIIFKDARQSLSIVLQVAHILAVGECAFEFEHRDLHWGNVMVENWKAPAISYLLNGDTVLVPSCGIKVVVIDFTISRLKDVKNSVVCLDLQDDDEQFLGTGDHQFDIYRMMRDFNRNDWQKYCPKSNVFWLHYLAHKFSVKANYSDRTGVGDESRLCHKKAVEKLINFSHFILEFDSTLDFVKSNQCEEYKKFLMSVF